MQESFREKLVPIWAQTHLVQELLDKFNGEPEFSIDCLPQLNKILYGFDREKFVVIGARPSEGKSAFSLFIANYLSQKHKVLYLSLEMTTKEAMFRLMCQNTKIPNTDFYSGRALYQQTADRFIKDFKEKKPKLVICEDRGKTWEDVISVFEELKTNPPDILILDYIQCINTKGMKRDSLDEYIKSLRRLAIDLKMCVIVCSQIGRSNMQENKEPTMEGLKETGTLEEHADKVLLMSYPCKRNHTNDINKFKVIVAKNKDGMTGYNDLRFIPEIYSFKEEER